MMSDVSMQFESCSILGMLVNVLSSVVVTKELQSFVLRRHGLTEYSPPQSVDCLDRAMDNSDVVVKDDGWISREYRSRNRSMDRRIKSIT
ncbi:hypothetical protein TNIN_471471 [Trichonephila inaurata madagascariensis]|uniref:Uncharacterized protein n=1 Tax=Trichonephila inaurata madagascariensis TaxID=2747483 RepID=A0A8X6WXS1_9ARAC|nr:hypothetical protein TNIN_471471 [Trichonephila inaurata madagascariensis]